MLSHPAYSSANVHDAFGEVDARFQNVSASQVNYMPNGTVTTQSNVQGAMDQIAAQIQGAAQVENQIGPDTYQLVGWNMAAGMATSAATLSTGNLHLWRIPIRKTTTITGIAIGINGAASSATSFTISLYDPASGAKYGSDTHADPSSLTSTGFKRVDLASPMTMPPGDIYIGLTVLAGTGPSVVRAGTSHVMKGGLDGPSSLFATVPNNDTNNPASLPGSYSGSTNGYWIGIY